MHSLGHDFVQEPLHAGGLRYHGMAPLVSNLAAEGLLRPVSMDQVACYDAAVKWARSEGFISAPETSHALAAVVAEAHKAREEGREKTILFSWSGHGLMDLSAYDSYLSGGLKDVPFTDGDLALALQGLEGYPRPA